MRILYNANIYTLDPQNPKATALAIDSLNGRILAVGDDQTILSEFENKAKKENMNGLVILPGFTDAHIHLHHYAHSLNNIPLYNISKEKCLAFVTEAAKNTPPGKWILGQGWNQDNWEDPRFPTASELDQAAPDHPVYLAANSLHAVWVNSTALKLAKVNANTPDPENGKIGRHEDGSPNGMLYESAMKLVSEPIPTPTLDEDVAAIQEAQTTLWQIGVTGVHDFDRINSFKALQSLHQQHKLQLRVLKHLPVEKLDHILETGLRSGFGDDMLRIGNIKVFADGALGPRTAAMLNPYENEPDNHGMSFLDEEEFFEHARAAALGGLGMTVHAIGDKANHEMLNGYEQLRKFEKAQNLPHRRHRIEHAQILHPDDFARFKNLDIIASVQPIHATTDLVMADRYWGERSQYSYAWRTLLNNNIPLTFGSDAPVDSANPFHGIHAAVTRQRADGTPGDDGWYPDQKLTIEEAVRGYTHGPAYTAGMENRLGKLAPNFLADLILLDQDLFTISPKSIQEITPQKTMVNGNWVWEAE